MKKLIYILLLNTFLLQISKGQDWYPIGAEWYFNKQELLLYPAHGYTKYIVEKDTIVASYSGKKIIVETYNFHSEGVVTDRFIQFVREENGRVYSWNGSEFKLMYDFTLNPGDTLEIEFANYDCDSVSPIIVDSICQIEINEEYFDVQHLSYFQYWPFGDPSKIKVNETIIEKIGRVEEFLFKPICQLDTEPWEWLSLRCYKEGELIFRSDEWDSFCPDCSCDTLIDGSTGVVKYKHTSQFLIYPNPCQDWIIIEHPISIIKKVLLYNSTGQLIEHREPKNNFLQLNIGMQEDGIYYLIIESENLIESRMLFKL